MAAVPHQYTTMQFQSYSVCLHHSGMCANPFCGVWFAHDSCKIIDNPSMWALWLPACKMSTKRSQ